MSGLVCPECGEKAIRKQLDGRGWSLKVPGKCLRHTHVDGSALCPVMGRDTDGGSSYIPALPVRRKS